MFQTAFETRITKHCVLSSVPSPPLHRDSVDEIVTVSEEDIRFWMRVIYERMKLVIEPSAAVGVAALMSPHVRGMSRDMKRVGVVLCGGNVGVTLLHELLAEVGAPSPTPESIPDS